MMLRIIFFSFVIFSSVFAKVDSIETDLIDIPNLIESILVGNNENINNYPELGEYLTNKTYQLNENGEPIGRENDLAPDKIKRHGYPFELHNVETEDGYILEMHRIPDSPRATNGTRKRPVLLMHGLLDSSSGFLLMDIENCLPFILADLGYDVWLGNARGNSYSRKHIKYNPNGSKHDRRQFWSFSWHEIGFYDLPAMIDYVLRISTNYDKLHYIGYSQGTTSFFVMTSERPEYNEKILMMNALAPATIMQNTGSPIGRSLAIGLSKMESKFNFLGQMEFLPSDTPFRRTAQKLCEKIAISKLFCRNVLFMIGGANSQLLDPKQVPEILSALPAGASVRQLTHYGQLMQSDRFQKYNFGKLKNKMLYGTFNPPRYPLEKVTAPVALHYGADDLLANSTDVERLSLLLPNVIGLYKAEDPNFNHFDFLWANNIRQLWYDDMVKLMEKFETN